MTLNSGFYELSSPQYNCTRHRPRRPWEGVCAMCLEERLSTILSSSSGASSSSPTDDNASSSEIPTRSHANKRVQGLDSEGDSGELVTKSPSRSPQATIEYPIPTIASLIESEIAAANSNLGASSLNIEMKSKEDVKCHTNRSHRNGSTIWASPSFLMKSMSTGWILNHNNNSMASTTIHPHQQNQIGASTSKDSPIDNNKGSVRNGAENATMPRSMSAHHRQTSSSSIRGKLAFHYNAFSRSTSANVTRNPTSINVSKYYSSTASKLRSFILHLRARANFSNK